MANVMMGDGSAQRALEAKRKADAEAKLKAAQQKKAKEAEAAKKAAEAAIKKAKALAVAPAQKKALEKAEKDVKAAADKAAKNKPPYYTPEASSSKKATTTTTSTKATTSAKTTTTPKANVPKGETVNDPRVPEQFSDYFDMLDYAYDNMPQYNYTPIAQIAAVRPELMSAARLAELYGLDYNYENMYNTLMKSVDRGYDVRYADQGIAEGKYYDNAATAQNTLLDTLRQQQSQAILAGTNRGMQAANTLSSMLGVSQEFAQSATQLAQDRGKLAKEYAAAQASTGKSALDMYNAMGADLGELSKSIYSSDTSSYAAELGYNSDVNAANAAMEAEKMRSTANMQAALSGNLTSIWNQYHSGQISLQAAQIAADAQIESARVNGVSAASINAASNAAINAANNSSQERIANINADSYKYTTDATNRAQMNSALTGLVTSVNDGSTTPENALKVLDSFYGSSSIDKNTYDNISKIFKVAPVSKAQAVDPLNPNTASTDWLKNLSNLSPAVPSYLGVPKK